MDQLEGEKMMTVLVFASVIVNKCLSLWPLLYIYSEIMMVRVLQKATDKWTGQISLFSEKCYAIQMLVVKLLLQMKYSMHS